MVSKLEEFKWQELTETCYNVTPKPQVTRKNSGDVSLHGNPAGRLRTQAKSTYRLLCVVHAKRWSTTASAIRSSQWTGKLLSFAARS
jgi:hypothetical protein